MKYGNITPSDTIITTEKVTKGLFTGDVGTIQGSSLTTSSLSTTQKTYYHTFQLSGEDQFSVSYGHKGGSGSADEGVSTFGKTRAIYKQFADILLPFGEVSGGFKFGGTEQQDCYFITFERARMKDRVNKGTWTLTLSGSVETDGVKTVPSASGLVLTDASKDSGSIHSPVGESYEIRSGSAGVLEGNQTVFGRFYPTVGVLVLSATQLSASLPGGAGYIKSGSDLTHVAGIGLGPDLATTGTIANNSLKLGNSVRLGSLTFRNEEDQTSVTYFCRAKAPEFNFSNNPTFQSASGEFAIKSFEGNPQVLISTVGLYNSQDHLMAVGRLSAPFLKNYSSETTIKVKLTY
jgi:hypothetical protein